jgi:hypothetical protein
VAGLEQGCAELAARLEGEEGRRGRAQSEHAGQLRMVREEHDANFAEMGVLLAEQRRVSGEVKRPLAPRSGPDGRQRWFG